jgi:hypothetical protein
MAVSQTSGVNSTGMISPIVQPQTTAAPAMQFPSTTSTTAAGTSTDATGGLGSLLGSVFGTAANTYGAQNAAEDISQADQAAIGTQTQTLGNINTLYGTQTNLGNSAMSAIGSAEGLNGSAPNYSGFENMPGYQFAVQQGTQAIQRQAAANGSAYTPNTAEAVGQYVTGTAMQDYNTYINQLQQSAGLGAQANQTLAGANLQVGGNISQLQQNSGMAQASGVSNAAGSIGNFLNGAGGSALGTVANGIANGITGGTGGVSGAISNWLGASSTGVTAAQNADALSGLNAASTAQTSSDMAGITADTNSALTAQDAANAGGSLAESAGGAGTAAAAADQAGLFGTGAATGGGTAATTGSYADYLSNLAQTGYASNTGVAGSIAASDTTGGGAAAASDAAGAGSLGLGLAGAGAVLGVAAYGASKPGTQLGTQWYNTIGNNVGAGLSQNATVAQKLQAVTALQTVASMANTGQGHSGLSTDNNFDTQRALQVLAPYGVTTVAQAQQLMNQILNSIPPGQMPGQSANRFGTTTVGVGNMGDTSKTE